MTTQQVTIELPEPIFRQLVRIAEATHQPVEALVTQSVISNLPPFTENAPTDIQPELLRMQTVDKDELKAIAYAQVEPSDRERHLNLLKKNEEDLLTAEERQELTALRLAADHLMLRKAYAWSILRWRGQRIPPLQDLPVSL
ncbi:hypothetical protein [Nostoc sphaeroides]|uniref:Uncharacterized protein n=1 Tax=Nostoc sphaeroides CCNUC1 TaxID=2653204 RepID=A0A5P8WGG0_9NOSO|nr:hypothetical protein [Nostoc sphaeroides]QFS51774.1 hypothetical protein GXM_09268 [Nostoc sphaeroides CCNUC1]